MQTITLKKMRDKDKSRFCLLNTEIRIETTNYCNYNCIMCPREKMTRKKGIMEIKLYKSIIDEAINYNITNLFLGGYGEPLTDHFLIERIKYAKSKGLFVNFISNGSLINNQMAEALVNAGLDEVRFSFYGTLKDTYERIHRIASFDETKKNIKNLIDIRHKYGSKGPRVLVFFLILDENKDEAEGFKKEWIDVADAIEIWKPHNFGDGRCYRDIKEVKRSCGRPEKGPLQVQWDGTVIPCCWDYNGTMILGDLNKQSIRDALKTQEYRGIRKAHQDCNFDGFPFCANCDQLNEKKDSLVFTNRHNMPLEMAVGLTNSNLFNLK